MLRQDGIPCWCFTPFAHSKGNLKSLDWLFCSWFVLDRKRDQTSTKPDRCSRNSGTVQHYFRKQPKWPIEGRSNSGISFDQRNISSMILWWLEIVKNTKSFRLLRFMVNNCLLNLAALNGIIIFSRKEATLQECTRPSVHPSVGTLPFCFLGL